MENRVSLFRWIIVTYKLSEELRVSSKEKSIRKQRETGALSEVGGKQREPAEANTHTYAQKCISRSIPALDFLVWGLNREDARRYRTQRWFVLGTPRLSDLMSCSESWQPGPAKVTGAFARGPAHFRSCLAKLCSTWWLVRSHKSTTSSAPVWTHTLDRHSGRRADGVTLTTIEINSCLVLQLSQWQVVSGNPKSRCCLWGGWLSDCRKEMPLKRQIFDKTVVLCPSAFTERKKNLVLTFE